MTIENEPDGGSNEVAEGDQSGYAAMVGQFDELVKAGALYYDYDFMIETRLVDGFQVVHSFTQSQVYLLS